MKTLLPFFGIVRISGEDRASFLHSQLSNDIANLAPLTACYATYNSPKGRVLANMLVLNCKDSILLVMARDLTESMAKRLRMFVLRAKVTIEPLPDWTVGAQWDESIPPLAAAAPTLSFPAEETDGAYIVTLPHQGRLNIAPTAAFPYDGQAENAWNLHEILSGYPWICDATKETAVAQMLNQHIIGGVHFKKGCYPGQEIIARAQYRGQVKRGLAVISSAHLEHSGQSILQNGEDAGLILNSAATDKGALSLAVVKFSAARAEDLTDAGNNPVKIERLFFTPAADI